jgi:2-dehydropantoate 2-reductase
MRFAVLGAGAIGAYLGAALAKGGADVVLIARGEHLAAIRANGLRVQTDDGETKVGVAASDQLDAAADADVVVVALKAYSLPAIAAGLAAVLRPGSVTVWAQNGIPWWYSVGQTGTAAGMHLESVDPGGAIARAIPAESVVGAVVYIATELPQPGVVRVTEGRRVSLGEPTGLVSDRCHSISAAFTAGGLRAPVVSDLRSEIWLKLLGNATFNPISALTSATLAQLGEVAQVRALLLEAFGEIAAVASALHVSLPVSLERRLEAGIAVGDHQTSMLQDVEAGKPLEYRCMTSAVIEIARRLDIKVPRMETLDACVAMLDHRLQRGLKSRAPGV